MANIELVLNTASRVVIDNFGLSIAEEQAKEIIKKFNLTLTKDWEKAGGGIIGNETGAKFIYNDVGLRIVKTWMGRYKLYKGVWKRGQYWTGD